ncbi:unnamed protein product, partial [Polarella glacialis]
MDAFLKTFAYTVILQTPNRMCLTSRGSVGKKQNGVRSITMGLSSSKDLDDDGKAVGKAKLQVTSDTVHRPSLTKILTTFFLQRTKKLVEERWSGIRGMKVFRRETAGGCHGLVDRRARYSSARMLSVADQNQNPAQSLRKYGFPLLSSAPLCCSCGYVGTAVDFEPVEDVPASIGSHGREEDTVDGAEGTVPGIFPCCGILRISGLWPVLARFNFRLAFTLSALHTQKMTSNPVLNRRRDANSTVVFGRLASLVCKGCEGLTPLSPQSKHTQSPGRFCALAASPVVAASAHAASAKSFSPRDNLGLRSQLPLGCCLPMHDAAEHDLALLEVNSSVVSTGRGEFRGCYGAFNVRKGRACLATQEAPNEGAANITKRCSFSARSKPCKSGCGILRIGTQASARQMRCAVGGTPAESTLAVSMEIAHRSRTVLSAFGHFLQVQFLRELDPSCRAATDSVSPVQSGMPLAQFLGLHGPCGAIQEAGKRSSLAHLQMPCSDRRHIATKIGQQTMCGASWCFPLRRELNSHCAGSCASLGLVSARKPLLLPIGASRIQQPTGKKMRAAFCKLTSKLSASSLEDLGLMELPSAHKKDMSVVRCGSFLPAAVDASREGLAKSSRGRAFQQPFRLPCLRLRCLKLAAQPQQEQQYCKLDCKPQLQLARRAGSLLPTRNCPTFQLDNSIRVPCGRAHGLRLVCVVSSRGQLQGTSLCALSAWDPQTLIRCEKRDSILQSSLVRTCQNFVTSLPAASSNSSVLECSKSQRSGQQVAAAECLLRCVIVEQDTACMVGAVHLGSGSSKFHAAFCNLDAATTSTSARGPMHAITALGHSLVSWPLRARGKDAASLHNSSQLCWDASSNGWQQMSAEGVLAVLVLWLRPPIFPASRHCAPCQPRARRFPWGGSHCQDLQHRPQTWRSAAQVGQRCFLSAVCLAGALRAN